jgi:hypothetical protein
VVLTLLTISFLGAEASSALYERHKVSEILFGFYGPIGRVWEFGAGALIAIAPIATASQKLRIILKSSGVLLITLSSLFFLPVNTQIDMRWSLYLAHVCSLFQETLS